MFQFNHIYNRIDQNKISFLIMFFFMFTGTFAFLYAVDFYPEPLKTSSKTALASEATSTIETVNETAVAPEIEKPDPVTFTADTLPNTLTIDALDRSVKILNPASNSVSALDTALLSGVVRHPDSATFGEEGNMFILGHSSYLPTVHNRNFQALNGIQNLKWGDTIKLSSTDTEYTYKVEKVYKAKASAVTVPIKGKGKTLTIATCNSFGSTDDRYIVEATLVATKKL